MALFANSCAGIDANAACSKFSTHEKSKPLVFKSILAKEALVSCPDYTYHYPTWWCQTNPLPSIISVVCA